MNCKKKTRIRYDQIVHELARLSHDGWHHAKSCDYQPLEQELRKLAEILYGHNTLGRRQCHPTT